jgi:hypothetical protein
MSCHFRMTRFWLSNGICILRATSLEVPLSSFGGRINRPRGEPFGFLDGSAPYYGITANAGSFDAARLGDGTGEPDGGNGLRELIRSVSARP